jgi:hypothetical protein
MANANDSAAEPDPVEPTKDGIRKAKFGVGIFLAFLAAILGIGAVVFIWFGVFPGLVLVLICLPVGMLALHLIRKGKPVELPE